MNTPHTIRRVPGDPKSKAVRPAIVTAVGMLVVIIFAATSDSVRGQDVNPGRDVEIQPDAKALQRTLRARTDLTVERLPLHLAVTKLAEMHDIVIKLDADALAAALIALDTPVTTSIRNYTLQAALFHVIGNDDLQFTITDNVLAVTVAPPNARLQEPVDPPLRQRRIVKNKVGAKSEFVFAEGQMVAGRMGIARFNGMTIICTAAPDPDVPDGEAPVQDKAPPRMMQVTFNQGNLNALIFGQERDAAAVHGRLALHLDGKIKEVDRICRLSDAQKEKLRLAGRGDMKRLLDRALEIKDRFENTAALRDIEEFEKWARALCDETEVVRLVLSSGPFDGNSRFARSLKRTLTPEQAAEYARAVVTERSSRANHTERIISSPAPPCSIP